MLLLVIFQTHLGDLFLNTRLYVSSGSQGMVPLYLDSPFITAWLWTRALFLPSLAINLFIGKRKKQQLQTFIKTTVSCFTIKWEMMEGQNGVLTKIPEREGEAEGGRAWNTTENLTLTIKITASCVFLPHILRSSPSSEATETSVPPAARLQTYSFFPHCLLKQPTSASSSVNLWLRLIFTGISALAKAAYI